MCIESDTLYWLLSTLIQAFAAILSIVGFFVVFRIQSLNNMIKASCDELKTVAMIIWGSDAISVTRIQNYTTDELLDRLNEYIDKQAGKDEREKLNQQILKIRSIGKKLCSIKENINDIKKVSKTPIISIGVMICIWIGCLGIVDFIENYGIYVVSLSIIISGLLIYLIIKLILKTILETNNNDMN